MRRYLRKVYRDPMTGKAEWGLVMAPGGGVEGVYSLSTGRPMKRKGFDAVDGDFERAKTFADWRFLYEPKSYGVLPSGASGPAR